MHTHFLEQIATIEPQFDPDQFSRTQKQIAPAELGGIFDPSQRICSHDAECVYFLEPEIENIVGVILGISTSAEPVVLNSDMGYLSQICTYLINPTHLNSAFVISIDETRQLQCWNIDLESARQMVATQPISDFSKGVIAAPKSSMPTQSAYSNRQQ